MKKLCALIALFASLSIAAQNVSTYHPAKAPEAAVSASGPVAITPMLLTFSVREVNEDGKTVNSREFKTRLTAGTSFHACRIRAGSKIPIQAANNQFTYMDVGANFDCQHARFQEGLLTLQLSAEINSISSQSLAAAITHNAWDALISLKPGVKTVVFTSDELASKRTFEISVRADLIKELLERD